MLALHNTKPNMITEFLLYFKYAASGLVAARRVRMGFLPRKSEVVHAKLTLDLALEQLRLQYVT